MTPAAALSRPAGQAWLQLPDEILLRQCRRDPYQASGPGGQKRNRVYSAIRLIHAPSGLAVTAADHRSAQANLSSALHRLRRRMAFELRGHGLPPPTATDLRLSPGHPRHPLLLATLADALDAAGFGVADAAAALGLSTGRLVRVLARDPEAWQWVNAERHRRTLPLLRHD